MLHNRLNHLLLVTIIAVSFTVSCESNQKDTTAEDLQSISAVRDQFTKVFNQGDAAAASKLYTKDAKFLAPNSSVAKGRRDIQTLFQSCFDIGERVLQINVVDISVHGDIAHEVGNYSLTIQPEKSEAISDIGKYVIIWKREDGNWKLNVDIGNTSQPYAAVVE